MKVTNDGRIIFRILLWGSVLKRNFQSSLFNKLQESSSNFLLESNKIPPKKVNEIFWESNTIRSREFDNLSFELYNVGYKHPPRGANKFSLDWLSDYTEEEQDGLREMFPETDGVLFIANSNEFVEDTKSMNIKLVNEWERTKNSLRLLREVAGDCLGMNIPLVNILIYNGMVSPNKPQKSPNVIQIARYAQMLGENVSESDNVKIYESFLPPTNLPTNSFSAFVECVRLVGLSKLNQIKNGVLDYSNLTIKEVYTLLLKKL